LGYKKTPKNFRLTKLPPKGELVSKHNKYPKSNTETCMLTTEGEVGNPVKLDWPSFLVLPKQHPQATSTMLKANVSLSANGQAYAVQP